MDLHIETHNGWMVVKPIEARLDAFVAQSLRTALMKSVVDGTKLVVIDLSEVEFMDSSGLGALVFFKQYLGEDASVALTRAQPGVAAVLHLTHLDKVFAIVGEPEELVSQVS